MPDSGTLETVCVTGVFPNTTLNSSLSDIDAPQPTAAIIWKLGYTLNPQGPTAALAQMVNPSNWCNRPNYWTGVSGGGCSTQYGRPVTVDEFLWQPPRPAAADLDTGEAHRGAQQRDAVIHPQHLETTRHG